MFRQILNGTPLRPPADAVGRERMRELVVVLPDVEETVVGYSMRRRPVYMYKFGNGRGRVALFGAHHALESITANVLYAFIYILHCSKRSFLFRENDPALFMTAYTYYVIPCLNPDGIEMRMNGDPDSPIYGRVLEMSGGDFSGWQANARGVDLNHNYDYRFAEYKRLEASRGITPGPTRYSGEYPESEPESRLAANLVRILNPDAVVSLHSQGEEIFYSPPSARRPAELLSRRTGYCLSYPSDTAEYGGLCDYTGNVLGIPSFTIEIGRGKNPLPESDITGILGGVAEALLVLPSTV